VHPLRRATTLLTVAALAAPGVAHAQGGAGDNQYQDPFGPGGAAKKKTSTSSRRSGSASGPSLTSAPPTTLGGTGTSASAAPATTSGSLPNTGFDAPEVALFGLGLLACGIGLRLRTVDETVF
jgi:hypothetical protein